MKKIFIFLISLLALQSASAQFSVAVNGNYTMYKQDFQQSTPGAGFRVYYGVDEKIFATFGFVYGFPINVPSFVTVTGGTSSQEVATEVKYNFKTFNLMAHYSLIGDEETTGRLYGSGGIGFVLVSYKEKITETYDHTTYSPGELWDGNESGFTINLGIGGEYKVGKPVLFADAGIALPANQTNGTYVENNIPTHFTFNIGARISLGGE
jgi:hypothetical protein